MIIPPWTCWSPVSGETAYAVSGEDADITCAGLARFAKEAGEAMSTLAGAVEDNRIDEQETAGLHQGAA